MRRAFHTYIWTSWREFEFVFGLHNALRWPAKPTSFISHAGLVPAFTDHGKMKGLVRMGEKSEPMTMEVQARAAASSDRATYGVPVTIVLA